MVGLDSFKAITRDGVTFHVDKYGWPVETCRRCGGTGRYSYCQMYGDTCFECSGAGVVIAYGKAATIRSEYSNEVREQRNIAGYQMTPCDRVRRYHTAKTDPYLTVVSVQDTGQWCSKSRAGSEPEVVHNRQDVTFEGGETVNVGAELWHRKVTIVRGPYVEDAQAAHVAKLRRARKVTAKER